MKPFDPIEVLGLPEGALVDLRVPKTLLIENGAATAADKRRVRDGIDEIRWLAALKPTTVGLADYCDAVREYREVAVLRLTVRSGARIKRLTELVHSAVPYPVLLIVWQKSVLELSLAHKRWSQGEADKTVVDGDIVTARLGNDYSAEVTAAFCDSLAINRQPRITLHTLYQGWINAVRALHAASVTGNYLIPASSMEAADRATALQEYAALESRIAELSAAAGNERQIARRAALNLELQCLRTDQNAARARL